MRLQQALKNPERERSLYRARVWIASGMMALLALVIVARLVWLQVVRHEHFTTLSHDNRLRVQPIAPPRGLIFSSDGMVLAENRPSFSLIAVREKITNLQEAVADIKQLIQLNESDVEEFQRQLGVSRRFDDVTVKSDLSEEELAVFSVNRHRFPGFSVKAGLTRHYPLGAQFAHVVGYVGRISDADLGLLDPSNYAATSHTGKTGVERAREDLLHGTVGYEQVEVNALGRVLRVVDRTPPVPGADLHLTIDAGLQMTALAAMDGRAGAVVALEPWTGAALVLASSPSFEPDAFVNGISRKKFQAWNTSTTRPLFNRALQGQYPPGSTIKPLVGLTGLEYGLRTTAQTTWCPGWYSLPGDQHRYRDWLEDGHGHVGLKQAIARSCDVYFYSLAHELGIRRLREGLSWFGLGEITGIDIPGENRGLLPSPEWKKRARNLPWYPGETLIAGIGQGFMLTTPLQLAYAIGILATRGAVAIPHVLSQVDSQDPGLPAIDIGMYQRSEVTLKDPAHWDEVIADMEEVVHGATGTARRSGDGAAVRFAGKTGTAQVFGIAQDEKADELEVPEHLKDHALFVAFAPVEDPELVISIVVEHGEGGSKTAAPIARRMIDYYFQDRVNRADIAHEAD